MDVTQNNLEPLVNCVLFSHLQGDCDYKSHSSAHLIGQNVRIIQYSVNRALFGHLHDDCDL